MLNSCFMISVMLSSDIFYAGTSVNFKVYSFILVELQNGKRFLMVFFKPVADDSFIVVRAAGRLASI